MRKLKRDDEVIVITGKDKGKRGKVSRVLPTGKLIVEGINLVKKHQKPNPQMGVTGGIVEKEMPNLAVLVRNLFWYTPGTPHHADKRKVFQLCCFQSW